MGARAPISLPFGRTGLFPSGMVLCASDNKFVHRYIQRRRPELANHQHRAGYPLPAVGRFYRTIPAEAEKPLHGLWHSHQRCLRSALASGSSPLLLDCHSFPTRMSDVDICIGFNEDWSKPDTRTIEYAVNWFEDNGFKVGINTPYSNSIAPECSFRYHSMMLEINKKAYLKGNSILLRTRSGNRNRNLSTTIAGFMAGLLSE